MKTRRARPTCAHRGSFVVTQSTKVREQMSKEGRNLRSLQSNTLLKEVRVQMGWPVTLVKDFSQGTKRDPRRTGLCLGGTSGN